MDLRLGEGFFPIRSFFKSSVTILNSSGHSLWLVAFPDHSLMTGGWFLQVFCFFPSFLKFKSSLTLWHPLGLNSGVAQFVIPSWFSFSYRTGVQIVKPRTSPLISFLGKALRDSSHVSCMETGCALVAQDVSAIPFPLEYQKLLLLSIFTLKKREPTKQSYLTWITLNTCESSQLERIMNEIYEKIMYLRIFMKFMYLMK